MLESVAAGQVEETPSVYTKGNPNESFDDLSDDEARQNPDVMSDDDWSQDEGKPSKSGKEEVKEELKLLSDFDDTEDEKSDTKKDEKPSKEQKELEKTSKESEDSEEKSTLPSELSAEAAKGKIRIRVGEDIFGLEQTTPVRVKVDGSYTDVPLADLVSNYSGKVVYDKKFAELGTQRKEVEALKAHTANQRQFVDKVTADIKAIVGDNSKDPYEAISYLAEMVGIPTPELHKRSMEARLDELGKLLDMSDVERENYFLKKETDYLRGRQTARQEAEVQAAESERFTSHVDQIREKHGVSESLFVEAMTELEEIYSDDPSFKPTPEFVVDYAVQRPYLNKSKELVMPYADEIGSDKLAKTIQSLANMMREYGVKEADVKAELESRFGVTKGVKDLNAKLRAKGAPEKADKKPEVNSLESFDDFED